MSEMVPEDWRVESVGECCEILDSQRIPLNSEERAKRPGDYPYYGANGIQGFVDDYIFDGDAILVAEDGGNFDQYADRPIAQWVTGRFWVNNHAHIIRATGNNFNKWVYYSLVHKNILKYINGGTRAKLNQSDLKEINIPLPPLKEQKKIASILTSVDEVIENTQKQIDKLDDLKKATMNELLTKGIGHTEFKDSELGRIPKSWEVRRLGELVGSLTGGVSVNSENRTKGAKEMGILKTSCISKGAFFPSEHKTILASEISRVSTPVQRDKIIFSRMNTPNLVGESGYVSEVTEGLYLPDRLWLIDVEDQRVTFMKWLSWLLVSRDVRTQITHIATGTSGSMKNISKPNLLSLPVAVPTLEEQKKIALTIDTIDAKIKNHSQKLSQTQSLKKSLMQDLLTGKVRVQVN